MRTVTFAAPPVKQLLTDSFACAVINTTGDPSAGASFSHSPKDPPGPCLRGNGEHNVQILVLTPAGELFHVISGYIGPEDLQQELTFALATYGALKRNPVSSKQIVRDRHLQFLKERGYKEEDLEQRSMFAFPDFSGFGQSSGGIPNLTTGQFSMDKMFDGFIRQRVLADHRFAIEHPMMPFAQFRAEELVGDGESFFGSTSSGSGASTGPRRTRQSRSGPRQ
jgi:hypothetical protein